jgi:hypothetical protein
MPSVLITIKNNYCIISSFDEDIIELADKVQELLDDGWSISGGISSSSNKLYQALVKA